jgi:tripartite-type tricarboxylate transporter receptor subunit TctC
MARSVKRIVPVLAILAILAGTAFAAGEKEAAARPAFPTTTVRIVASFGAGGANDILARIAARYAEKYLGQKIIVQNYPGGGQVTGQLEAWHAPTDGYTLLTLNPGIIQNPILKDVPFTYADWELITLYNLEPEVFAVRSDSPYKTFADAIEASKQKALKVATPGALTNPHICGMYVEKQTGARFEYVHAESGADETMLLLGGHADAVINTIGAVYTAVQEGDARLLGVMGEEIPKAVSELDKTVTTFYDQGYDVGYWAWRGLAVKKGTPPDVVEILREAFAKVARDPEMIKAIEEAGFEVVVKEGDELKKFIEYQQEYMSELLAGM